MTFRIVSNTTGVTISTEWDTATGWVAATGAHKPQGNSTCAHADRVADEQIDGLSAELSRLANGVRRLCDEAVAERKEHGGGCATVVVGDLIDLLNDDEETE